MQPLWRALTMCLTGINHTRRRILMKRNLIGLLLLFGLALSLSLPAAAQEAANAQSDSTRVNRVPAGQKQRLRGVIVKREADSFILRDLTGSEVQVNLSNITKVESLCALAASCAAAGRLKLSARPN